MLKNGWKYIKITGEPYDRGRQYGEICAQDFKEIQGMLKFLMYETFGKPWEWFIDAINKDYGKYTKKHYPELYEEMRGIAAGCVLAGTATTVAEIIAWNYYLSIPYWIKTQKDLKHIHYKFPREHCSAFMAVGKEWTTTGEIIMAHNSFADYIDGQYAYIILSIEPAKGATIIMQTSPCWIWSGTDFFITSYGIIGTETTIGGFDNFVLKAPIGYRIRTAMQYGKTLDEYVKILVTNNSGDYASSWLFGDINGGEIMRVELGLIYVNVERTLQGVFIGFNAAYDPRIRQIECKNDGFYDIRRHQGARNVRLGDLMAKYKGQLSLTVAKKIISDHYDVYLNKRGHPCSRTVCSHYDLDAREYMSEADRPKPYALHGTLDGIVTSSTMAKHMGFYGRFGNSCGRAFDVQKFAQKHHQWTPFIPFIHSRPSQPWTYLSLAGLTRKRTHTHNRTHHTHKRIIHKKN